MNKKSLIIVLLYLINYYSFSQSFRNNFIFEWSVFNPNISESDLKYQPSGNSLNTIMYIDEYGRMEQMIKLSYTPNSKDLIFPMTFNEVGLDEINYKSFSDQLANAQYRTEIANSNKAFYSSLFGDEYGFAPKEYEKSPLHRELKIGNVGRDWQLDGHYEKIEYITNSNIETELIVKKWVIQEDFCKQDGIYDPYSLYAKRITDEDNHVAISFFDKDNRLLLYRSINDNGLLDTYYVYNNLGNLSYVISPEGSFQNVTSFLINDPFTKKYVYVYKYDSRNRMCERQVPGQELEYFIYDKADKLIMYSNENMHYSNNILWKFFKYDSQDRIIVKGFYTDYSSANRTQMQNQANNCEFTYELFDNDAPFPSPSNYYYTNRAFPNVELNIYNIIELKYFDRYELFSNTGLLSIANNSALAFNTSGSNINISPKSDNVIGLETISFTKFNNIYLTSVKYYDDLNRVIQERSTNHLNGTDIKNYEYQRLDIKNSAMECLHKTNTTQIFSLNEIYRFYYDNGDRLVKRTYQCGSLPIQSIVLKYNDSDLPVAHEIYENSILLQTVDYDYNIRGWLKKINEVSNLASNGDLFAEELFYNDQNPLSNQKVFNGNISAETWSSVKPSGIIDSFIEGNKGYLYTYDKINQIKSAKFYSKNSTTWNQTDFYNIQLNFDLNGNISSLKRNGNINNYPNIIDDLTYTYNGNSLIAVDDHILTQISNDFCDNGHFYSAQSQPEYTYDKCGNMKSDVNKGINSILYNQFNLPTGINFSASSRIEYQYASDGSKLRELVYSNGLLQKTIDYCSNLIFVNGIVISSEYDYGRVLYNNFSTTKYQYFLKDHLGNLRVLFEKSSTGVKVDEVNSYYPYGLNIKELSKSINDSQNANDHLYLCKSIDKNLSLNWYDFTARNYDPALGRWNQIDPCFDKYYNSSPYQYCLNNPINLKDIDGKAIYGDDDPTSETESEREYDRILNLLSRDSESLLDEIKKMKNVKSKKSQNTINKFNGMLKVRDALLRLKNSSVVYKFSKIKGNDGNAHYDRKLNVVVLEYSFFAIACHEIIHALQFDRGDLFFVNSDLGESFVDVGDELEAYAVQFMIEPESIPNNDDGSIQKVSHLDAAWLTSMKRYHDLTTKNLTINNMVHDLIGIPGYIIGDLRSINEKVQCSNLFISNPCDDE